MLFEQLQKEEDNDLCCDSETRFIDTRLHVSVRPELEYVVLELGMRVRDALFGDATVSSALESITLYNDETLVCEIPPNIDHLLNNHSTESVVVDLKLHMNQVHSLVREYLLDGIMMWVQYLKQLKTNILHAVARCKQERHDIFNYYDTRKSTCHQMIAEIRRVQEDLDTVLNRIRAVVVPVMCRSEQLQMECRLLRDAFISCKGVVPTESIIQVRSAFELELNNSHKKHKLKYLHILQELLSFDSR